MHRLALASLLLAITTSAAIAQPKPTAFAKTTTFSACSESWAFACGKPDGNGGTYGTAHAMKHCTTYAFAADGTFAITADMPRLGTKGTYRIVGSRVILTQHNVDGTREVTELTLSANRDALGSLKRL